MLDFELVKDSGTLIEYRYFCEGDRTREGRMLFDKEAGKIASLDKAEGDEHGFYWGHLASRLRKMAKAGEYEQSGMIAWW